MLGYIHFDRAGIRNHQCEMLVSRERIDDLVRNRYVVITSPASVTTRRPKQYLARFVEGPFFAPEELSRESALSQTAILHGDRFPVIPNYYAVGGIEILGELDGDRVVGSSSRPAPQSVVEDIEPDRLCDLLGIRGDATLGRIDGYDDLRMMLDTEDKTVLPRNVGIFGTVGSGKTNTSQALIEEAARSGYAVVVLDVEGEYVVMDSPSEQKALHPHIRSYGLMPKGLADFHVYHPHKTETARKDGKATAFKLRIADLDHLVLAELIDASEPQERRLLEVLEHLERNPPRGAGTKGEAPSSLRDVLSHGESSDTKYTLKDIIDEISARVSGGGSHGAPAKGTDLSSYLALRSKLWKLARSNAFDAPNTEPIVPQKLVVAGRVSVFDVSYTSDRVKNLVIAELLRSVFDYKVENADAAKTLIFIEEAHTFISADRVGKMQETVEMLREIARRGRKRWLGLVFVSQQPGHLPSEIFELCNTRIVHNVKSIANLRAMKATGGDVSEEMWNLVPSLGVGQAVVSTPQYRDPVVVNVRPCVTMRQFVE